MVHEVQILSTGGTIGTPGSGDSAVPTLSGETPIDEDSCLDSRAEISVGQVAQILSFQMDQKMLGDLFRRIELKAVDTIEGVVVIPGTDTMEESAYYLDVALSPGSPVVFTGAQRRPNAPGADGPANLSTAVSATI
jgi:L-asparaginase